MAQTQALTVVSAKNNNAIGTTNEDDIEEKGYYEYESEAQRKWRERMENIIRRYPFNWRVSKNCL
jgi:hypothetical protein